jgi:hypothetical protein
MVTAWAMFETSKMGVSGAGQIGLHLPRNLPSIHPKSRFSGQKPA